MLAGQIPGLQEYNSLLKTVDTDLKMLKSWVSQSSEYWQSNESIKEGND